MEDKFLLRRATLEDAPRLAEIYNPYVLNTTVSYEYKAVTAPQFAERMAEIMKTHPYIVAIKGDNIIGYAYAAPYHSRKAYSWDCELTVYVDREYCGTGAGTALYGKLLYILREMNYVNAYALIDYPNDGSMALHKKLGFTKVGTFYKTAYKLGKWLDMTILEKNISSPDIPKEIRTDWENLI